MRILSKNKESMNEMDSLCGTLQIKETVSAGLFFIDSCSPVVAPKAQSQLCLTFIKFLLIFRQDLHYFLHLCFSYRTLFPLQFNTYAAKLSFKLKSFLSRTFARIYFQISSG